MRSAEDADADGDDSNCAAGQDDDGSADAGRFGVPVFDFDNKRHIKQQEVDDDEPPWPSPDDGSDSRLIRQ